MEFQEALAKHFKIRGNVASGQVDKPRNHGRWALALAMADMGFQSGVEVGTLYGDSAEIWCSVNPKMKLNCVDPYGDYIKTHRKRDPDGVYKATSELLAKYDVTMIRKTSFAAVDGFKDGSLDFVHIDGDHLFDAVMMDLIAWAPKVRVGGIIALHDYFSLKWQGVTHAVNAYVCAHHINSWYITPDVSPTVFWEKT